MFPFQVHGKSRTLENYTGEFGGPKARGKRTFGIFVPFTKRFDIDDCEVASYVTSNGLHVKFALNCMYCTCMMHVWLHT